MVQLNTRNSGEESIWLERNFQNNGILGLICDTCQVHSFKSSPNFAICNVNSRVEQARICMLLVGMFWYKSWNGMKLLSCILSNGNLWRTGSGNSVDRYSKVRLIDGNLTTMWPRRRKSKLVLCGKHHYCCSAKWRLRILSSLIYNYMISHRKKNILLYVLWLYNK